MIGANERTKFLNTLRVKSQNIEKNTLSVSKKKEGIYSNQSKINYGEKRTREELIMYKIYYTPAVLYSAETWGMKDRNLRRLQKR